MTVNDVNLYTLLNVLKKSGMMLSRKNSRSYITLSKGVILATILEMFWLVIGSYFVLVKGENGRNMKLKRVDSPFMLVCVLFIY